MPIRVGSFNNWAIRSIPWPQALSWELLAALEILFSPWGRTAFEGTKHVQLEAWGISCNCSWRRLCFLFIQDLENKAASDCCAAGKAGRIAASHWGHALYVMEVSR